jgi:hypothetical protein
MKQLMPGIVELCVLATLAIACAAVIACCGVREGTFLACAFGLLLSSMLLGARRAGRLSGARQAEAARVE